MGLRSGASTSTRHEGGLITLLFIAAELLVGGWCMLQQIATTHDSIFGLLQSGVMIPSHMTTAQLFAFMNSNLDKNNKIAYTIALVTQIVFISALLPGTPIEHNRTLRNVVLIVFAGLEITSDLWYSVATGTTLGGAFTWVFNFSGGGWLASLCYIVAMSAGATLITVDAIVRLERLFGAMFRRAA